MPTIRSRPPRNGHARTNPRPWTRVRGTVYGIRCVDAHGRRTLILGRPKSGVGYVGMYSGWWRERIRQHLYGGGPHQCKPQLWRVLVPGFDPNAVTRKQQLAVVDAMIRRGDVFIIWQKRRLRWSPKKGFYWKHIKTFHGWVKLRESWSIFQLHPVHNILENTANPRHIPKWELERLLAQQKRAPQPMRDDRWTGWKLNEDGSPRWFGPRANEQRAKLERSLKDQ